MQATDRRLRRAFAAAAAALVLNTAPAAAQVTGRGVLTGTVRAETGGAPVAQATVGLWTEGRYTVTDAAGRFTLVVTAGSHSLEVRAVGFRPLTVSATVAHGDTTRVDVRLPAAVIELQEVVVSTSREARRAAATPLSVGVFGEEEIRAARARHPSDLVNRSAGVYVSNYGGEGHATAIRQPITTKAVYAYLEDGVPTRSTGFFNHNALYEVNLPQAGRIEIIKGPGSAVYGSDAIGGVVNSFTRAPSGTPEAELFVEGGGAGYVRALGTASRSFGSAGLRFDGNATRSGGWREGAGYQRQSGTMRWDQYLGQGRTLKTVVTASHVDQPGDGGGDLSRSDFEATPDLVYTGIAYRRVWALRASTAFEAGSEAQSVGATLYARYNTLDLMPSWQLSFDPQVWSSENRSLGVLTRYRRSVAPLRASLSAGLDAEYSPGSRVEQAVLASRQGPVFTSYTLGDVQYDYDVAFWQAAPYAQAEFTPLPGLQFSAGARYDVLGYRYDNRLGELQTGNWRRPGSTDVDFERLSPKLGITWEPLRGTSVFAAYRAAFRAPSESQLFRQGAAASTVDLQPVKVNSYEAGLRAEAGGRARFEVTAYTMELSDDILTFLDPQNGLRLTQNAGATRHRGIEVGAGVAPVAGLRLDAAVSYAKHRYLEWRPRSDLDYSGNEMELAPNWLLNTRVTWQPAFVPGASLGLEYVRLGAYWQDPENQARYAGHQLVNAQAAFPVTRRLELVGRVSNLTDARYAETSSWNRQQGERLRPGAPRTFYLGAQYRYQESAVR